MNHLDVKEWMESEDISRRLTRSELQLGGSGLLVAGSHSSELRIGDWGGHLLMESERRVVEALERSLTRQGRLTLIGASTAVVGLLVLGGLASEISRLPWLPIKFAPSVAPLVCASFSSLVGWAVIIQQTSTRRSIWTLEFSLEWEWPEIKKVLESSSWVATDTWAYRLSMFLTAAVLTILGLTIDSDSGAGIARLVTQNLVPPNPIAVTLSTVLSFPFMVGSLRRLYPPETLWFANSKFGLLLFSILSPKDLMPDARIFFYYKHFLLGWWDRELRRRKGAFGFLFDYCVFMIEGELASLKGLDDKTITEQVLMNKKCVRPPLDPQSVESLVDAASSWLEDNQLDADQLTLRAAIQTRADILRERWPLTARLKEWSSLISGEFRELQDLALAAAVEAANLDQGVD